MKICFYQIEGIPTGKHNVKDPKMDQVDKLVEAKKKTYAQVDVIPTDEAKEADVIIVSADQKPDLILHDLEFIEMRLERNPDPAEKAVMERFRTALEKEEFIHSVPLSPEEVALLASYEFLTRHPVVIAQKEDLEKPEAVIVKAFHEGGYISYLTVGGKENRAWPIKKGLNAWEAAGVIHTDIQKGFIRAEIISYEDLVHEGGETQAKRAGKMRLETKQYIMQDCDITNFRFNK